MKELHAKSYLEKETKDALIEHVSNLEKENKKLSDQLESQSIYFQKCLEKNGEVNIDYSKAVCWVIKNNDKYYTGRETGFWTDNFATAKSYTTEERANKFLKKNYDDIANYTVEKADPRVVKAEYTIKETEL